MLINTYPLFLLHYWLDQALFPLLYQGLHLHHKQSNPATQDTSSVSVKTVCRNWLPDFIHISRNSKTQNPSFNILDLIQCVCGFLCLKFNVSETRFLHSGMREHNSAGSLQKFLSVNALALSNGSLRLVSLMHEDRSRTSHQNAMF